ncbi:hypothetical protein LTR78_006150 [Recurvomyces mirabilis]|uniref:Uncharacterized protein n=1 Tax=Recurvomyces mirabilis TaxID=574656 RepID=A0AAE0WLJ6_9PEZI|nr:hypothetical protein LTR78_006150 [Recurvomyces mirabilis]KAK5151992.1 hypothetical protein LTS14_008766 [Recurvomyces mirabilis]
MTAQRLTHDDSGRLIPICCAADVSAEVKDRLLQRAQDYGNGNAMQIFLVFVDSLTIQYNEQSEHGHNTSSDPASPFKDKTSQECAALLQELRRNGADIDFELFAIIDKRSLQDETALIVDAQLDGEEFYDFGTLRVPFELTYGRLASYSVGDASGSVDSVASLTMPNGVFRER